MPTIYVSVFDLLLSIMFYQRLATIPWVVTFKHKKVLYKTNDLQKRTKNISKHSHVRWHQNETTLKWGVPWTACWARLEGISSLGTLGDLGALLCNCSEDYRDIGYLHFLFFLFCRSDRMSVNPLPVFTLNMHIEGNSAKKVIALCAFWSRVCLVKSDFSERFTRTWT
jgi:hypothetical protein